MATDSYTEQVEAEQKAAAELYQKNLEIDLRLRKFTGETSDRRLEYVPEVECHPRIGEPEVMREFKALFEVFLTKFFRSPKGNLSQYANGEQMFTAFVETLRL